MKKTLKNEIGITLIVLVVTIVVLLILAATSISMLTGENGIIKQATNARTRTEIGRYKEEIDILAVPENTNYLRGEITFEQLVDNLENQIKEKDYVENVTRKNTLSGIILETQTDLAIISVKLTESANIEVVEGTLEDEVIADENIFNWEENDDGTVIIRGFNFDNIETKQGQDVIGIYGEPDDSIEVIGLETLIIPPTIDGKEVTTVTWDQSINTEIGLNYNNIKGIKEIVYPETVVHIGTKKLLPSDIRFYDVISVKFPEKVTNLEYGAFFGMENLRNVDVPSNVVYLDLVGCMSNDLTLKIHGKTSLDEFDFVYLDLGPEFKHTGITAKVEFVGD